MRRSLPLVISLFSPFILVATAATAAPAGYYHAVPASVPEAGKSVVRGLVWTCAGEGCAAPQGNSRPAIVCAAVARELGPLTSFSAAGEAFDAAALAKCNAKAKPVSTELVRR